MPPAARGGRSLPFGVRFWWPSAHFLSWRGGEGPADPREALATQASGLSLPLAPSAGTPWAASARRSCRATAGHAAM